MEVLLSVQRTIIDRSMSQKQGPPHIGPQLLAYTFPEWLHLASQSQRRNAGIAPDYGGDPWCF